jgi:(p)ppGpp synthase/HD superfamily hydrolase
MKLLEVSLIQKAEQFAREVHTGQFRKSSMKPYIVHPLLVYKLTKHFGFGKNEQIIALLHDTYEDGADPKAIADYIGKTFGSNILSIVLLLSHDKSVEYNTYLLALAKKSPFALNVKLCDMIANLSDAPTQSQYNKYKSGFMNLKSNNIYIQDNLLKTLNKIFKLG